MPLHIVERFSGYTKDTFQFRATAYVCPYLFFYCGFGPLDAAYKIQGYGSAIRVAFNILALTDEPYRLPYGFICVHELTG